MVQGADVTPCNTNTVFLHQDCIPQYHEGHQRRLGECDCNISGRPGNTGLNSSCLGPAPSRVHAGLHPGEEAAAVPDWLLVRGRVCQRCHPGREAGRGATARRRQVKPDLFVLDLSGLSPSKTALFCFNLFEEFD